jgi:hypothetical protein
MNETLIYFLKAHRRGRKHMKTMKAHTAIDFGLASFEKNIPPGWRLVIGEEETEKLLKLCERREEKLKQYCKKRGIKFPKLKKEVSQ